MRLKAGSHGDAIIFVALICETHKFITKKVGGFLTTWRKNATQGDARMGSKSSLASCCVYTSVDTKTTQRNALFSVVLWTDLNSEMRLKVGSQSDTRTCVALIRETHKFITKKGGGGVLDDQTQERNAGERKDRIRFYPSVVSRFYRRRSEDDATHCLASYCEPALRVRGRT